MEPDIFNGLFDLNRDGETDFIEMALGMEIINSVENDEDDEEN